MYVPTTGISTLNTNVGKTLAPLILKCPFAKDNVAVNTISSLFFPKDIYIRLFTEVSHQV